MMINGISGGNANAQPAYGMGQLMDSYSKNIQNQISNAQKQLQELSSNEEMSMEDKVKKRQEIQQKISDLNNQLRQHQIEVRKQAQQKSGNSMDDLLGGKRKTPQKAEKSGTGMSSAGMKALISADKSMDQVRAQGSVKTQLEGRAGVLEAEISQDAGRGASTEKKEAELADLKDKTTDVTKMQMETLSDISEEQKEASKADTVDSNKAQKTKAKEQVQNAEEKQAQNAEEEQASKAADVSGRTAEAFADYTPVDIRL